MTASLPPPESPPERLLPGLPLPPYRYVPGVHPHPFRHEGGHDHEGRIDWGQPPVVESGWAHNRRYLHGLDLFNHRFYWESHEVWEAVWLALPKPSAERELVQGLIQVAAALLKRHQGLTRASDRLLTRARTRLGRAAPVCWGIDVVALECRLDSGEPWPTVPMVAP